MTILAPKKSGQAAKEQEGGEQSAAHQAQQPPRSPQVRAVRSFKSPQKNHPLWSLDLEPINLKFAGQRVAGLTGAPVVAGAARRGRSARGAQTTPQGQPPPSTQEGAQFGADAPRQRAH